LPALDDLLNLVLAARPVSPLRNLFERIVTTDRLDVFLFGILAVVIFAVGMRCVVVMLGLVPMLAGVIGMLVCRLVGLPGDLVVIRISLASGISMIFMSVISMLVIVVRMACGRLGFGRRYVGEWSRGLVPGRDYGVRVMTLRIMGVIVVVIMVRVLVAVIMIVMIGVRLMMVGPMGVAVAGFAMVMIVVLAIRMVMAVMIMVVRSGTLIRLLRLRRILSGALDYGALDALTVTAAA
jgi:hypothetical protein